MTCFEVTDASNVDQVQKALKSSLSSKLSGYSTFFAGIVAQACSRSLPAEKNTFDIDHIRVVKILGGALEDSYSLQGMVISRGTEGTISRVSQPKIAVYGIPLDPQSCETKATVLIKNADELLNYTRSEEEHAEKIVKKIAEAGATCIIVGGTISELMLHYIEKYKMMVVKLTSKFELKRVCKAINANAVTRLDAPLPEEIGYCDEIYVKEIGSHKVVVIKKETSECRLNTIVLRGSTNNLLDDVERAIDDGVNVFKCLIKDGRFVPGAGSAETILSYKLQQEAKALDDLS
jgi:T-complex protein 1 subunit theta